MLGIHGLSSGGLRSSGLNIRGLKIRRAEAQGAEHQVAERQGAYLPQGLDAAHPGIPRLSSLRAIKCEA